MREMKKLTAQQKFDLEKRIKRLLLAGLDYCENTGKDENWWFSPLNPYYCEAFGILHALEILNYGEFGPDTVDSDWNLKFWFNQLKSEVEQMGKEFGPKQAYYKILGYEN